MNVTKITKTIMLGILDSMNRRERNLLYKFIAILISITIYLMMRVRLYPCPLWGDEAWYYHISKDLHWGWDSHLSFLPPIRWAFMIIMHPFTQNTWTFRLAYVMLNALSIVAVHIASGSLVIAFVSSLMISLNPYHIYYSFHVYTSTLSATLALLSLSTIERIYISLPLAILSVGTWEGMLFSFLAVSLGYGVKRRRYLLFLFPVLLAILTSYDNVLLGHAPPGWTKAPIKWDDVFELFSLPYGLFLLLSLRDLRDVAIAYSQGLGLIAINLINGAYPMSWYVLASQVLLSYYIVRAFPERRETVKSKRLSNSILLIITLISGIGTTLYYLYQKMDLLYSSMTCVPMLIPRIFHA